MYFACMPDDDQFTAAYLQDITLQIGRDAADAAPR
jgi:hypothetical protein